MVKGSVCNIKKIVLCLFMLPLLSVSLYSQGTAINGVINQYRHVVSIGGIDNVTLNDADIFSPGDTVLLIQMKGAVINVPESGSFGGYQYSLGGPGLHEFLIILSVNTLTDNVIFTSNITNTYSITGIVQLIKVPYHTNANVNAELTCQPWDSTTKTGGVLALIVGGTLTLNSNINVSGKGFIGGTPFIGQGICIDNDPVLYGKFSYPESYLNSGYKGESPVIRAYLGPGNEPSIFPEYSKGKGASLSGGGGGNGRFSGGGGGGNYGAGGNGGRESSFCAPNQYDGGVGGRQLKFLDLDGRILLGSGGGSSTYEAGSTASPGSKGGGIIIIICDTLKGKSNTIKADGATPAITSSGNAGAGGGGGGGSVALYQQSFSSLSATSALTISVNGGQGGNANNQFGEGGGGGGGLILTNNLTFPGNVITTFTGGPRGTRTGGSQGGSAGANGDIIKTFTPVLNGFLFNTIRSSVTNNHIDSVCSNMVPPKITGTKPVGGTGTYSYIWQKSYESTFNTPIVLTNDADPTNYTPTLADAVTPTDTVWFRRIVVNAGPPLITDVSKPVKIIVHPSIENNNVGNPDTICINGNPPLIQQLVPDLIVPTTKYFLFSWQDSSSSATWGAAIANSKNYDPPGGLANTTWYRRTVRSGSCVDSSAIVRINVLPSITNNQILSLPQDICFGMTFTNLTGSTSATVPPLGGGDNIYRYMWISDINSSGWGNAAGVADGSGYNPVELPQRIPSNEYYFRRIVYSGNNDACTDTSDIIHLRDFPAITGNTINTESPNVPICAGSAPVKLTGAQPANGNGVFTYTWQDSTNSVDLWKDIAGSVNITNPDYQPPVLAGTTSYRRIALSSACNDISNSVRILVHPTILNNNISLIDGVAVDTIICSGQIPNRLIGTVATGGNGIYSYQWLDSTAVSSLSPISGATGVNYLNPGSLTATTYYKRQVISGACIAISTSTITVDVLSSITNNVLSASQAVVCENSAPGPITGLTLAGGSGTYSYLWEQSFDDGASWTPADGNNNLSSYQPPVLSNPVMYQRTVKSGLSDCCLSISPVVEININPLPLSPIDAGPDATVYSIDRTANLNAVDPVISGESGRWTALDPNSAILMNDSDNQTEVRNLSKGINYFLWSVTNGLCVLEDSVYIDLLDDFIPQGFSPNGDEWNNNFIIEGLNLSDQKTAELKIVNGAGTEVYSTSNRGGQSWIDWDGKNNKGSDLPEGTYYYLLKITSNGGQVFKKSGFILLKRY